MKKRIALYASFSVLLIFIITITFFRTAFIEDKKSIPANAPEIIEGKPAISAPNAYIPNKKLIPSNIPEIIEIEPTFSAPTTVSEDEIITPNNDRKTIETRIETRYAIISFTKKSDYDDFAKKIRWKTKFWKTKFYSTRKTVDSLFEKVQKILEMHKKMKKVDIKLFSNQEELNKKYFSIYHRKCKIRAWYEYRFNTIYINVEDVHGEMLAHEMTHCIVDHYLLVRPPRATAEILARYVDSHIHK